MRGRKPKPFDVRVVDGTRRKRPKQEPDPAKGPLGYAPTGMTKIERGAWNMVRRECPWLRRADRTLIQIFCRSWYAMVLVDRRQARLILSNQHPDMKEIAVYQRVIEQNRAACLRMMAEMGATPTSRARVSAYGKEPDAVSPAEKYFQSG